MADWNGLMIAALARAGAGLREPRYIEAAERAARFILKNMRTREGDLLHVYKDGPGTVPGFLDDHAFMAWGLLELFQADQDQTWLDESRRMVEAMNEKFWDGEEGGYFQSHRQAESLIAPRKDVYDGAVPSGNSIALLDLLLLYRISEQPELMEKAEATINGLSGAVFRSPDNYSQFLNAVDFKAGPSYSIVIAGNKGHADTERFFAELAPRFLPNKVVLLVEPGDKGEGIRKISPLVQGQAMKDGMAVAHVCTDRACLPETTDPVAFAQLLRPA
jgi:uncharacterized protein YyaL (SSP411 family)